MTSRPTIEDIARAAGVSRQTVTRAMNGMPRISEATRAKILGIADELGYRPSRFAANLARSDRAKAIGLVVDSFRNPYYSELTADLLDASSSRGWQVTVSSHENENELELIGRLSREVDAVVGYFGERDQSKLATAARGVPIVLIGRTAEVQGIHSVDFDFEAGFGNAIEELRAQGALRFGLLESHAIGESYAPSSRRVAYERSVDPRSAASIVVCQAEAQSVDAGERGMRELMKRFPDVDTVFAFSDLMAMGALRGAHGLDLDVPDTVRVIGIDGLSLGAVTSPALTSLALVGGDLPEQVATMIDLVLARAEDASERRMVVPPLIWRESA